jgi:hypothetical protein
MPEPTLLYPKNQDFLDKTAPYPVHPVEIWTNVYVQASETHRKLSLMGVLQAVVILGLFGTVIVLAAVRILEFGIGALSGSNSGGVLGGIALLILGGICMLILYGVVRLAFQSATAPDTGEMMKLSEALVADYHQTTGTVLDIKPMNRSGKERIITYTYQDNQQRDVTRTFKTESRADLHEGDTVVVISQGEFSALL